jgi:membrane associated rhomboid family serine protease
MSKGVRGAVIEVVVTAIGWGVCLSMLVGAWTLGWWIASHLDGVSDADRNVFGLLSALAFLWIYERREAHERYNRLCERLDRR